MNLIGAEIRVGVENGDGLQEAKLIPLEGVFPEIKGNYRHSQNLAEVTFHTSEGDVTMRVVLPRNRIEVEDHKLTGAIVSDPLQAIKFIQQQLEKLP